MAFWCAQHGMKHTMQTVCSVMLEDEQQEKAKLNSVHIQAKIEVLRELAKELASLQYVRPGEPGREKYEAMLAIRRGNTDAWLKAKADELEKELT